DRERLARMHGLKAAGNGRKLRDGSDQLVERDAAGMRGGEGCEQVEDVDFAGQVRVDRAGAERRFECERGPGWGKSKAARTKVCGCVGTNGVSESLGACATGGGSERACAIVMRVEHSDARRGVASAIEEKLLGGVVVFHRAVEIEVVAREIGED